jgi:predicted Rossmann fold nucleotide-binding protein DprA/Smf involved in DNA uptake
MPIPQANAPLADEIATRGLLVSEFALGTQALRTISRAATA